MIPVYVLVLSIALTTAVTVLIMEVWYSRKSKELRDTLKEKQERIRHLNEIMQDRNNQNFDCYNRLNRELDRVHHLQEQRDALMKELHDIKQKEEQACECTGHVFKYKWDTSIGGYVLFCTTHNSLDCVSAVPAQCITDCPCRQGFSG